MFRQVAIYRVISLQQNFYDFFRAMKCQHHNSICGMVMQKKFNKSLHEFIDDRIEGFADHVAASVELQKLRDVRKLLLQYTSYT